MLYFHIFTYVLEQGNQNHIDTADERRTNPGRYIYILVYIAMIAFKYVVCKSKLLC